MSGLETIQRLGVSVAAVAALVMLGGCEAPLNLQKVEEEQSRSTHRFDHLKAIAASDRRVVVAADAGVLLVSDKENIDWQREQLPTRAALLNLAVCPSGRFVAVDTRHTLWVSDEQATGWQANKIDTPETLMALGCDANNQVWVGASFSTILRSADYGKTWTSSTQDEDLLFTAIRFIGDTTVAAGEFGTVMFSQDGSNWDRAEPIPNEFYPMGLYFADRQHGWVSGLGGTIYHTADGGRSWSRQSSESGAPLYNIIAMGGRRFALGDNGSLLELQGDQWRRVSNFTPIPTYLVDAISLPGDSLLLAGGGGSLIELKPSEGQVQ